MVRKMDRIKVVPLLIVMGMGAFLGWAVGRGSFPLAMTAFALGVLLLNGYFTVLRRRGHVLEDERTIRIEEISARRTLQVLSLVLAISVIYFATRFRTDQSYRNLMVFSDILLFALMFLHLVFRGYYSKVM